MNFFDFGVRHYSPALTRWLTPDPLSEKYYGRSPYAYCNGDPVNLVDPNGNGPILTGLISGTASAGVNFGTQVGTKMLTGLSFKDAVKEVDYASVGLSFVTGAIAPISAIGSAVKTAVQVTSVITDAAVDYDMKDGLQVVGSTQHHKDNDKAAYDLLVNASGAAIGSSISNSLAEAAMDDISGNALSTMTKAVKQFRTAIANTLNSSTVKFAEQEAVSAATSAVKEAVKYEINNPPAKTQVYMYFIQGTTDDEYQPYHYEQGK